MTKTGNSSEVQA